MHNKATYETALLGMLFALAMALSFLESTLTPVLSSDRFLAVTGNLLDAVNEVKSNG